MWPKYWSFSFSIGPSNEYSGLISLRNDWFDLLSVQGTLKNLPEMQETWVQSLGREDPLEREIVIDSSILAWRTSWTEEPGGLQSMWSQKSQIQLNG